MTKTSIAALLLALSLAAPAGAACLEEIQKVETYVSKGGKPAAEGEQPVTAKAEDSKQAAVAPPGYSQPQESWHGGGTPVEETLEDAKTLAQQGDEAACLEKIEMVKRTLEMTPAAKD